MKIIQRIKRAIVWVLAVTIAVTPLGAYAQTPTETITHYHNDIAGSPLAASDGAGNLVWQESYRPYGERIQNSPASGANKLWFHGKQVDDDSGLSYFGARSYDPVVGRFMGVDSARFLDDNLHSFNRFAYGNNNPYRYADRDGNFADKILLLVVVGGILWLSMASQSGKKEWQPNKPSPRDLSGSSGGQIDPCRGLGICNGDEPATSRSAQENVRDQDGKFSKYEDISGKRSIPNRETNVTRAEFERNLLDSGWTRSVSKDGTVTNFTKDGAKYSIRNVSKEGRPTADYYKPGSNQADLKIRLGDP